jgi:CD36 family
VIKEQTFVTHRVGDIIFDGFDDPLLIAMKDASFIIKPYVPAGAFMDRFGLFYGRNGTDYVDGVFNMYTGQGNVR